MHRRWLGELVFAPRRNLALEEMLQRIERAEALRDRLKAVILELVPHLMRRTLTAPARRS